MAEQQKKSPAPKKAPATRKRAAPKTKAAARKPRTKALTVTARGMPVLSAADMVKRYNAERSQVVEWVRESMIHDVDVGPMYAGDDKVSLLKPGAEKICIYLQLKAVFVNDTATWQMLGANAGDVPMICYLMNDSTLRESLEWIAKLGKDFVYEVYRSLALAEGRGVGSMSDRSNMTPNSVVKIVEKRATVDAVLRIAGLSELYTQDGEPAEAGLDRTAGEPRDVTGTGSTQPAPQPGDGGRRQDVINGIGEVVLGGSFTDDEKRTLGNWMRGQPAPATDTLIGVLSAFKTEAEHRQDSGAQAKPVGQVLIDCGAIAPPAGMQRGTHAPEHTQPVTAEAARPADDGDETGGDDGQDIY